jgi:hypothetical protein
MNVNDLGFEPTTDEELLLSRIRFYRTMLLTASDWAMVSDAPTDKTEWGTYRQALRDFPSVWTLDENPDFPMSPLEAANETPTAGA